MTPFPRLPPRGVPASNRAVVVRLSPKIPLSQHDCSPPMRGLADPVPRLRDRASLFIHLGLTASRGTARPTYLRRPGRPIQEEP